MTDVSEGCIYNGGGMAAKPHILPAPVRRWQCPSCEARHVTTEARPHTPMHACPRHGGLTAPYVEVPAGRDSLGRHAARHQPVERGDYIADETGVTFLDGRPVMAVRTERADGSNDATVYAPTANTKGVL